ncbi:solute carrier family 43 member 3-like [Gigantopelta aegis]|uniref:solute carrier family 43 member 3-like n=1 Tax=Gigantopelta aegis TaxID=1735272 RepID=UPI001B88D3C2|nr:solute carrier family 43 member 3-like [Gigantopelta aegis]XP_041379287.1 solute carrier family 43 member 3-like [Gigantopelta aegis]XP_041379288.1 solute carrier family 43 member 3-like [Gigantopelta aegis]XP_041379289.1 solute carrier family 43 member 3-like [Gigantopelta aegis]
MGINLTANPRLRMLYVVCGVIEIMLFSGLIFGWGSLVYVLKDEGIYADLCDCTDNCTYGNTKTTSTTTTTPVTATNLTPTIGGDVKGKVCKEQDSMLSLVFTVASLFFCVGSAVMGHINYKFGTRVTRICASLALVAGCLMVAFVSVDLPWLIFPGLSLVGAAGSPWLVTNIQISILFTTGSSTVVGLLCGAFDCSAVIQLIVKLAYENGFSRQNSYLVLVGLHSMVLVNTFLFLPKDFIFKNVIQNDAEVELIVNQDGQNGTVEVFDMEKNKTDPELGEDKEENAISKEAENTSNEKDSGKRTLKSCMLSSAYLLHVFWLCILQLRFYYYFSSLNPWINNILDGDKNQVSFYTNISLYFILGGIITSPLAGIVYDWQKRIFKNKRSEKCRQLMPSVFPLTLAVVLAIVLSVLTLIPVEEILYLTFTTLTIFRSFLYAMAVAFVSEMFPNEYFGLMFGVLLVAGGIFGFLQFALFQWAEATDFDQVIIFLLVLICTSFVHPAYQWYTSRRMERLANGDKAGLPMDTIRASEGTNPEPEDAKTKSEDTKTEPEDTKTEPEDTKTEPKDTKTEPEDTKAEPEDTNPEPEDAKTKSEDTKTELEDAKTEPEDTKTEPEDTKTDPEDTKTEPGDPKTEPEDTKTEPEDTKTDGMICVKL